MAPKPANKRSRAEVEERFPLIFEDPKHPRTIYLRNFLSNTRRLPLDDHIQLQLKTLCEEGLLGSSFYDPIASLPRLQSYKLIHESVGRFIYEGEVLCNDLKAHLGRWDPDLKAAAVAAKGIAGLAQLICMAEMVGLGNSLEAACLSGSDPFEIYGLCHQVRDVYQTALYKLSCLMIPLKKALSASPAVSPSYTDPSAAGPSVADPSTCCK